jgi:hypothetical protein
MLKPLGLYGVILLIIGAAGYGFFIEPGAVDVRHIHLNGSPLAQVLQGKTLVHISDLHLAGMDKRARKVIRIIEGLTPDLVFLTGDYVRWNGDYDAALEFLSGLKAEIGVIAVMGDYDYSNSRKSCLFCHEPGSGNPTRSHEVKFLRNSAEPLDLPGGRVWVAGLDSLNGDHSEVKGWLEEWRDREPMILLSHNPLNFDLVDETRDVLMLSGDTHGGQIPLPSWVWRILGYEKNAKYNDGFFEKGRKKLFVSRGIGTSHIPFRLFKRPEVLVLHCEAR